MAERSAVHATFAIERIYGAAPSRVFAAWSDKAAKQQWFACHGEWVTQRYELDFRIGGEERLDVSDTDGMVHGFVGYYHDVVPGERIVYSYGMHLDERRISVSLATVEFKAAGSGTRMIFTEQGAFLDGYDEIADRKLGTEAFLDNFGAYLATRDTLS